VSRAGGLVNESLEAVGRSAVEVRGIIAAALENEVGYQAAELGPGSYQLVRSYRPSWAIAVGVLTTPLLGLGLLFFLVRKVESCTTTVSEGSTGAIVTLSGRLAPATRTALTQSVRNGRASEGAAAASPAVIPATPLRTDVVPAQPVVSIPVADQPSGGDDTVFRPGTSSNLAGVARRASYELRFDDGEILALEVNVVVGRDPSVVIAGAGARRLSIDDTQMSKAHAIIGEDETGPWVEDLHSTNGTFVHVYGQDPVVVPAGERHRVSSGSVVRFGTRFATISRAS